jgi:hypothetical protein
MERGEFGYDLVLVLHLVAVIVGFGTVVLNGLYGAESEKRKGPGGLAIGEANLRVSTIAEWFIYTVPLSGIGLVLLSDAWDFDQTWVWLSLALYTVGIGVSHASQIPAAKRMNVLAAELVAGPPPGAAPAGPPPQVAEMEQLGKRLAAGGAFLNLLLATILVLMVFKPGI